VIIYQAEKKQFLDDVFRNDIDAIVLDSFTKRTGHKVSKEEIRAWASSLGYMGKVLNDEHLPDDCGVAIEYTIPQTAKRVDFLLTGKSADERSCVIIVELKQWAHATMTDKDAIVSTRFSRGEAEVSHPSYQAWSYAALLQGFNEAVYGGGIELRPCAYLHNYPLPGGDIIDAFYAEHIERAPVFLQGESERRRLRAFIQQHVRFGDKGEALYRMEKGRIRPSKSLADGLVGMLKGSTEFVLVDDQKLVYETALQYARKVQEKGKRVLIVEGGPGTGKSVVAINLLVGLTEAGLTVKYVTKNAAPRAVYEARLVGTFKKTHISNLFTGSGSFTGAAENDFDALVIDEAHRLNEKSGIFSHLGENQIKELIAASRLSVFFIDESQKVTLKDIGDKEAIRRWAKHFGAQVTEMELASQFRCNGSDGYLAWLDHNLQVRDTANEFLNVSEFDFRVVDSPAKLRDLILEKNKERNRARMVAGYCWSWPSEKDPRVFDIHIPEYGFKARWNFTKGSTPWIEGAESVQEVGCIHTCQGLEVDYIGVIVGNDLIVRNGRILTRPEMRARSDKSMHGLKKLARADSQSAAKQADALIKNTYRTLMTRGMKGCYVYFIDAETAEFFRSRLRGRGVIETVKTVLPLQVQEQLPSRPFRLIASNVVKPFRNAVPVIPLRMAAGSFSETQTLDPDSVEWAAPDGIAIGPDMFIAQVVGESMNKRIPNGAWCLFRRNPAGTRQGKVVLAQHRDISDPETGGSFTVKLYSSEKARDEQEGWTHTRIILSPSSNDGSFQPIVLQEQKGSEVAVLAELIAILG
jgi:uncharacterized protein